MFYYSVIDVDSLRSRLPYGTSPQYKEVHQRTFSIMHNRILASVLQRLPTEQLEEFARRYAANAADATLLDFLRAHAGKDIDEHIRTEFTNVVKQLGPMLDSIEEEPLYPWDR